jgi:hypothetical protein
MPGASPDRKGKQWRQVRRYIAAERCEVSGWVPSGALGPAAGVTAPRCCSSGGGGRASVGGAEQQPQPPKSTPTQRQLGGAEVWERIGRPKYVVAPMVDQSELAFRLQCREWDALSPFF